MNAKTSKHTSYYSLVSKNELPFHCPPKEAQKWNMHPKVFLPFDKEGRANCPYCGAIYKLEK
jgi:uncharacterized Zn-finger protein